LHEGRVITGELLRLMTNDDVVKMVKGGFTD